MIPSAKPLSEYTVQYEAGPKIDQILYLVNKLDLGTKVLYRSPSVLPPPKSIEQAINIIVNERSGWYSAIEEHMMSKLKKDNEKECE